MKVNDLLLSLLTPVQHSGSPKGQEKFSDLLKEALQAQKAPPGPEGLSGPNPIMPENPGEVAKTAQEWLELVVSRLELYQEALSRPALSLKSISPLLQSLEQDSRTLTTLARSLPADSALRALLEEAAAITWTESWKFKRGDYV